MNRDELAESLRIGFKAMIVEADEWRPLADYIISLLDVRLHENTQCNLVTLIDLPDSPTIHLLDEESSKKFKMNNNDDVEDLRQQILFLKEERLRLQKKLEEIENLSKYAWEQVDRNPEEAKELFKMIAFKSK